MVEKTRLNTDGVNGDGVNQWWYPDIWQANRYRNVWKTTAKKKKIWNFQTTGKYGVRLISLILLALNSGLCYDTLEKSSIVCICSMTRYPFRLYGHEEGKMRRRAGSGTLVSFLQTGRQGWRQGHISVSLPFFALGYDYTGSTAAVSALWCCVWFQQGKRWKDLPCTCRFEYRNRRYGIVNSWDR